MEEATIEECPSSLSWSVSNYSNCITKGNKVSIGVAISYRGRHIFLLYICVKEINLSIAHAAALAVKLMYLNVNPMTGELFPNSGLFTPLTYLTELRVPTLPNITFYYKTYGGSDLKGIFDLLYFSIKPNATVKNDIDLAAAKFSDVFEEIAILRHPLIIPQKLEDMHWPGDGEGPLHTYCLIADCAFGKM